MDKTNSVLIVGAGPVGLLLGCALQKNGIDVTIIEKRLHRSNQSKALSMNASSMALLHSLGVIDRFLATGQEVSDITVYWNDKRISHVDYRRINSKYRCILAIPQPETERLLEEYFLELGGKLKRGAPLSAICKDGDIIYASTAEGETLHCDYLIGCDGSNSVVRKFAGIEFTGFDYGMDFYLFDAQVTWEGKRNEVHYYVREDGFVIVIPLANGSHRFVLKYSREVGAAPPDKTEYQKVLAEFIPEPLKINDIFWQSKSSFYNRLAKTYRANNIFLAGDACHLFSPIGGLGMNTGFQDAWNLAWKLTAVIKGRFSECLLDSYNNERRAVAEILRDATDENTKMIARIDKDLSRISRWLPSFNKRDVIKRVNPDAFSGLTQRYQGKYIGKNSGGLSGYHVPWLNLRNDNIELNSYDLIDGESFFIITNAELSVEFLKLVNAFNLKVYYFENVSSDGCLREKFGKESYLLLRPDGVVALHENVKNISAIEHYLERKI